MRPSDSPKFSNQTSAELLVGKKLKELRGQRGYSLRYLADRSGLNVNTLSLIENGKTSPSVSTLQQLAFALDEPIAAFFESEPIQKSVVFTSSDQRPQVAFDSAEMQNLGKDYTGNAVQAFVVTLDPVTGSGDRMIVHTGHEFVYCLKGTIHYRVENEDYYLKMGDSLLFEAHLPHCWENKGDEVAQIMLIIYSADDREEPGGRHF